MNIKRIMSVLICCVLCLGACGEAKENDEPETDLVWAVSRLQSLKEEHKTLTFYPSPLYEYTVAVDEELVSLLNISSLTEMTASDETAPAMIYTDIPHENGENGCRIAWLPDGRVLFTAYEEGALSDKTIWYRCDERQNGETFAALIEWIDEHVIEEQ